jgi:hypothetical protein
MVTAWDETHFSLVCSLAKTYTLTTTLAHAASDLAITITNVYGPSDHTHTTAFLDELCSLRSSSFGAWLLVGDFNLIRETVGKNNGNFDAAGANAFNSAIQNLALLELPLLDRSYTWSNQRVCPVLARLDRAFFNVALDAVAPNTTLTSLPNATSDHAPLLVTLDSATPKTACFRFKNVWLHDPTFLPLIRPVWEAATDRAGGEPAGELAVRLKDCCRAAKVWSKNRNTPLLINNCTFIVLLLDLLEDHRFLNAGELELRRLCKDKLAQLLRARAAYWKQRGKVKVIKEADENTKFHHAHASQRIQSNKIKAIEKDGVHYTRHVDKARLLEDHFATLLGASTELVWDFSVAEMYAKATRADPDPLVSPFTTTEALMAVRAMNPASAPGPDGFGPGFYRSAWDMVKPTVMSFLAAFHAGTADLERINRAHAVLIPKSSGTVTPNAFRPISPRLPCQGSRKDPHDPASETNPSAC